MRTEVSAGGVIVYVGPNGWEVLLIRDMNGNWTFPKGIIEANEDPQTAARREVKEEVGIGDLTWISSLTPITYFFTRNGGQTKKIVHYFLFTVATKEDLTPQAEEGITEAKWYVINELDGTLGYSETNKPLLTEAREQLASFSVL